MGEPGTTNNRVATSFDLVQKQRRLVATTQVGSPAHRQASEVLALIEESHFLLSELDRVSSQTTEASAATKVLPRRKRMPVAAMIAFAAAVVAAATFLELADPAPMSLQADEVSFNPTQP